MADEQLIQYILDRLSAHADPDDIAYALCQEHNLTWDEAKQLIANTQQEHGKTIQRRRAPLMVVLALGTFVLGSGLVIYSAFELSAIIKASAFRGVQGSFELLAYMGQAGQNLLIFGLLGGVMVTGSLIGMKQIWSGILFGEE